MQNELALPVQIYFTNEFKRNLRQLAKRYRHIKTDVQPILDQLGEGETPGDQIQGVDFDVFKVRVANSDSAKGKSGGYRLIYQRLVEQEIILITIYSKPDQSDISAAAIRQIISQFEVEFKDIPPTVVKSEEQDQ